MAIGSMSAYSDEQQFSLLLSWGLVILTSSVWLIAGILLLRCCLQIVTTGKSPGSWAFDVFIDHHAGSGAITARSLQMILYRICKGKVFYDVDEQIQSGSICDLRCHEGIQAWPHRGEQRDLVQSMVRWSNSFWYSQEYSSPNYRA